MKQFSHSKKGASVAASKEAAARRLLPVSLKSFALLHGSLLLYTLVGVFAKYAALHMGANEAPMELSVMGAVLPLPGAYTLLFLALEILALLVYTVLWQQVLRRMPLSFAYSNKAICTLWTFLVGLILFGEALTLGKAAGIVVVLAGVWLVVTDHE